jgi:quercetin dioxygenase-like cupin family protein
MAEARMSNFLDYRDHTGSNLEKAFKATLFESPRLMLGLNCLEPGQIQAAHTHGAQDKFYFVVEGEGEFNVGAETRHAGAGLSVWAPAGVAHGVANRGVERLVVLVGIAPWK